MAGFFFSIWGLVFLNNTLRFGSALCVNGSVTRQKSKKRAHLPERAIQIRNCTATDTPPQKALIFFWKGCRNRHNPFLERVWSHWSVRMIDPCWFIGSQWIVNFSGYFEIMTFRGLGIWDWHYQSSTTYLPLLR